jgi:hypothetical protein
MDTGRADDRAMSGIARQIEAVLREFRRRDRLVRPSATEADAVKRAPQPIPTLVGERKR